MILTETNKTIQGYEVINLKFNQIDNIYVGLVKDPLFGDTNLRNGFICVQWSRQGKPLKANKGRIDLILKL